MRKLLVLSLLAVGLAGPGAVPASRLRAASFPNDDRTIVHVLNRAGFGPRGGDVGRVRGLGLQRYIEDQLQPQRVADASMDSRLDRLTTVRLSPEAIFEQVERPLVEERRQRQRPAAANGADPPQGSAPTEMQVRSNRVVEELAEQKLLRAIYSERQLQEVLADFWFNHFNVDARKGRDRFLLTAYERDAIRPHVLGRFRTLLEATAKSPAMLFYLDNWMSVDPNGVPTGRRGTLRPVRPQRQGLNENYARELMELHTLGVDGGYSQRDVSEVARAFTGWTIGNQLSGRGYFFDARVHDGGEKVVLGHRIAAGGGESDGEQVLDILASHPATARFIAAKLVRRFVSDTPPLSVVDRAAARFTETGGDIREVTRVILTSPEFLAPEAFRAKVKSPLEFIVSAVRATGADVEDAAPLARALQQFGMPLYGCQPPSGYKDTADAWVDTGALVNRMNFALTLASGRMRGIALDFPQLGDDDDGRRTAASRGVVTRVLSSEASETTRAAIEKAPSAAQMTAYALASPEFQQK
jgi:uncharacterized protein (DUF1800 family)